MTHGARFVAQAIALAAVAGLASADLTPEVFTIRATVGNETGSYTVMTDDGWFDGEGNFYWNQVGDIDIVSDGGVTLATLSDSSIVVLFDPVITLNFNLLASDQNTAFELSSGLLSFPEIANPIGTASAGVTVTDVNGNGATLSPDGSHMYESQYNGEHPNGTPFASLLSNIVTAGAFQTSADSDEFPGGGNYVSIGEPVESMSAAWAFTLSARDLASGTSTFTVLIPTPASAALFGAAGLLCIRRRR